jgi:cyclopropane-fatty-acyl-phospholipid synthase
MPVESLFGQAEARAPRTIPRLRSAERWAAERLLTLLGSPPLRFALWNGDTISRCSAPAATLRMNSRRVLLGLLANPQLRFGEAYTDGGLEIEGDLGRVLDLLFEAPDHSSRLWDAFLRWRQRFTRHSLRRARRDVRRHYDLGNDFYALWLDRQMAYTCAYFPTPQATLEEAQLAKFDHVCRKLRLRPGERVVEAGCGWGSLALHMARLYGVSVTAYNVSREQIQYARERARREGLGDRVEFREDDYRKIQGRYDAFVSIGMLEHVGRSNYPELGEVIAGCLTRRGRGLLHSIGRSRPRAMNPWIERRIFPGAYIPSLREMLLVLEPNGLSMLDVEDLRPHYARTLEEWLKRFEKHAGAIERRFDASFVRAWRLYLASSIAAFRCGSVQLFQVLFARPEYPAAWTRAHLYASQAATPEGESWIAATS